MEAECRTLLPSSLAKDKPHVFMLPAGLFIEAVMLHIFDTFRCIIHQGYYFINLTFYTSIH